ncbi:hypothetical protein BDN71DRAFT_1430257 [Pleurotus eryngii]|uniref:Uncharacterized protein n=1 Tax=Pleurotus eryngii TaxID=5323 RepID=A0A9P6A2A7_PLEER|nr:hypothetical protein BDN71DRAFT_1430257 [Pleurotus eryngii]
MAKLAPTTENEDLLPGNLPNMQADQLNSDKMNLIDTNLLGAQLVRWDLAQKSPHTYFQDNTPNDISIPMQTTNNSLSQNSHHRAPLRPQPSVTQPTSYPTVPISPVNMSANNVNPGAANSKFNAMKELLAKLPISVRVSEAIKVLHKTSKPPTVEVDKITQPAIALPMTLNTASPGEDVTIDSCIWRYATIQQASSDDQAHKVIGVLTSAEFIEHQEYNLPNGKVTACPKEVQCNYGHAYIVLLQPNEPEKPQPEAGLALTSTVTYVAADHPNPADFLQKMVGLEEPIPPTQDDELTAKQPEHHEETTHRGIIQPPEFLLHPLPSSVNLLPHLATKEKHHLDHPFGIFAAPVPFETLENPQSTESTVPLLLSPFPILDPPQLGQPFHPILVITSTIVHLYLLMSPSSTILHSLLLITKERTCNTTTQFPESSTSNEVTIQSGNNSAAEWDTAEIHVTVEVNMELESQENAMEQDTGTMDSIASTPTLEAQAKSPIAIAEMEAPPTLILSSSILPTQTANNLPTLSSLWLQYPDSEMDVPPTPTPSTEYDSPQNEDITMDSSVSTLLFPVHDSPTSSPHSGDSIMAQGHPSPGSIRESISSNLENDLVMKTSPSSEHNPTHNLTHAELGRHIHHLITQAAHELQGGSTATQSAPTTPETPSRFAKKPWKFSGPPSAPAKMQNTIARRTRSASKKTPASPSSLPPPTPTTRPLNSISPCPFHLYHNNEEAIMVFESDNENAELFRNGVLVEDEQGNLTIQVPYSQGASNLMAAMQSGTPTARENPETEDVSPGQAGPSIPTAPRPTRNMRRRKAKASKKTTNNTST